jgi:alpha-tubulin suppressor-like RCC1 family protein
VVALAACYHPSYEDCQVSCSTFGCPDGLTCQGGMCRTANAVGECAILPPDDAGPDSTGDGSGSGGHASQIVAGMHHTCALCEDGTLECWGANAVGQITGTGQVKCNPNAPVPDCDPTPVTVSLAGTAGTVKSLAAAGNYTCVLTDDAGTTHLYCAGDNGFGQLALDAPPNTRTLLESPSLVGLTAFGGGPTFACEIVNGRLQCQGDNRAGELAQGTIDQSPTRHPTPVPVSTVPSGSLIAAGEQHICTVAPNFAPVCWGDNSFGEVTPGQPGAPVSQPHPFNGFAASTDIASGAGHSCALTSNGPICWGNTDVGQVGDGQSPNPAGLTLLTLPPIQHLAAGGTQTCALTQDGVVYCWGAPNENANQSVGQPTQVTLPMPATAIAVGTAQVCAILLDGTIECWGTNAQGELGLGTVDSTLHEPTRVPVCE